MSKAELQAAEDEAVRADKKGSRRANAASCLCGPASDEGPPELKSVFSMLWSQMNVKIDAVRRDASLLYPSDRRHEQATSSVWVRWTQ